MATKTPTLQGKFAAYRKEMKQFLIERDDEIDIFHLALLARTHAFFLGSPGIAKSFLITTGIGLIDGFGDDDYFELLMMKSTTREDVFGPLSLSKLREDRYVFMENGYLPSAKVAFLDEMWKANGAIQNALLTITNERKYRNDGSIHHVPLHSMFIASNELPDDIALMAIYDRFPLRKIVNPINEPGAFINMLRPNNTVPTPVITWDEIERAATEVENVVVPDDVLEAMVDVKSKLKEQEILPSDRRFKQSLRIVQARAWLDGETEADIEHLQPLRFVLWSDPEEFPTVEKLCLGLSNPVEIEVMKIQADLNKLSAQLDKVISEPGDSEMRQRQGAAIYEKIKLAKEELIGISKKLKTSKKRSAKLSSAAEQVQTLTKRMLTKVFETTEEDIAEGLKEFTSFANADEEEVA